jgi:ADP-ribose pyrophosphatase YjhB (NUDIX family)
MPESITFHFCPVCGAAYPPDVNPAARTCSRCGFTLYENQNATVGAVIRRGNEILLIERGIDPRKGSWDIPGGFVEPDETSEHAILRELEEELGVKGKIVRLLGAFGPTWYEYQGRGQYNTDLFFEIEPDSDHFVAADDAAAFRWFSLDDLPPDDQLSFPSIGKVLRLIRQNSGKN